MLFKNSLSNFYSFTLIILFTFLFKLNGFSQSINYLISFKASFISGLIFILIVYLIIFSDFFNVKLFKIFLLFKSKVKLFNETNFVPLSTFGSDSGADFLNKAIKIKLNRNFFFKFSTLKQNSRRFSTFNNNLNLDESQLSIDKLNVGVDTEYSNKENIIIKETAIKNFHKTYHGGYLGYNLIHDFGVVPVFTGYE
jgi:hypothetical protein